jgi:hypothetical protein
MHATLTKWMGRNLSFFLLFVPPSKSGTDALRNPLGEWDWGSADYVQRACTAHSCTCLISPDWMQLVHAQASPHPAVSSDKPLSLPPFHFLFVFRLVIRLISIKLHPHTTILMELRKCPPFLVPWRYLLTPSCIAAEKAAACPPLPVPIF